MQTITTPASAVPHLTTASNAPLYELESLLLTKQNEIESWFRSAWLDYPAPFYASVDLRNAGFKLAPVDTNLFPAGFNNLNPAFMPLCIQALQARMERTCPQARRLLLIPENHTRNLYYLESLATIYDILSTAGYETRIASLNPDVTDVTTINLPSGREVTLEPIKRENDYLMCEGFMPCAVILNNDMSGGIPDILKNVKQPIMPPPELGWSNRFKSSHFDEYHAVVKEFCQITHIDPWLISPAHDVCSEVDFLGRKGEECLATKVDALLKQTQQKYDEYGITKPPFVVIKADAGTYGMGIMMVQSANEVLNLNRKQRTRMSASKEGLSISQVILQEGVYTFETWGPDNNVAEPVVYMLDHHVVGGFYRVHTSRGEMENLNAPGMEFKPLAFADSCITPDRHQEPDASPNRFYAYGVIARLALLAAAREIAAHGKEQV